MSTLLLVFGFTFFLSNNVLLAQGKVRDTRVMLQGFYWESYRFGHKTQFPTYITVVKMRVEDGTTSSRTARRLSRREGSI